MRFIDLSIRILHLVEGRRREISKDIIRHSTALILIDILSYSLGVTCNRLGAILIFNL